MAKPAVRGNPGPIPQGFSYEYDPRDGIKTQKPLSGTLEAMLGYSAQLQTARVPHSFQYNNETASAEIVITSGQLNDSDAEEEKPIDDWEVQGTEVSLDLFEHPKAQLLRKKVSDYPGLIKADVKAYNEGETVAPYSESRPILPGVPQGEVAGLNLIAQQLFDRLILGGTHYRREQYILSHTQVISTAYKKNIVDTNVLKILSPGANGQLRQEITHATLTTKCPDRLIAKIEAAETSQAPSAANYSAVNYFFGWLKSPSPERLIAGNKIQITTNYTLELWSLLEYEKAT